MATSDDPRDLRLRVQAAAPLRTLDPGATFQVNTTGHRPPPCARSTRVHMWTYVRAPEPLPAPVRLSLFSVAAVFGPVNVPASPQGSEGSFEFTLPDSAGIATLFNPPGNPPVQVRLECAEEPLESVPPESEKKGARLRSR